MTEGHWCGKGGCMWNFETDPVFQRKLDWADRFVREEVELLDHALGDPADREHPDTVAIARPLMQRVKDQGLWACHLGPELGGPGFGQVELALLNEILGRSRWAPTIFGSQAPDSGNAEVLAHFGTETQKRRFLTPLLAGEISSAFSMTEPHAGADPALFTTRAVREGDSWVVNGEKWFTTNGRFANFLVLMVVTDPEVDVHRGMSMFLVPSDTPGIEIVRNLDVGTTGDAHESHSYVRYHDVRVPAELMLGKEGQAFEIAQTRLGGGRVHQCMRAVAQMSKALDMMCERAVSRRVRSGRLADLQMTQERVADSWVELEQFKLLVMKTAWLIDKHQDYRKVRKDIAAVKIAMSNIYTKIVLRSLHLHGALGVSNELPLTEMLINAEVMAIGDGPVEVHKIVLAKHVLRSYEPGDPILPSQYLPTLRHAAARTLGLSLDPADV